MFNGIINKTSPQVDLVETISGTWDEYTEGEFSITKTPFFLVIEGNLDAGQHPLPFTFDVPVAATLSSPDGTVSAVIVHPGENAVDLPKPGILTIQLFGDRAKPRATSR
jgi:hypothetical protein